MSENQYLQPIPFKRTSNNSYISEDDFVELQDLPKFQRTSSSMLLIRNSSQHSRNRSYTNSAPQNRLDERRIISSYVQNNLRRCQSTAAYQKKNVSQRANGNVERRQLRKTMSDNKVVRNHMRPVSSIERTLLSNEEPQKSGILCRRSSFDYVKPSAKKNHKNVSNSPTKNEMRGNVNGELKRAICMENQKPPTMKDKGVPRQQLCDVEKASSINITRVNLRDSAIDLVSDEEDSEAYTAISLAGTLTGRNSIKPAQILSVKRRQHRKFYIIIGVLCGIILFLGGLAVTLALILFR